jgi:ribosomal protein S27AE
MSDDTSTIRIFDADPERVVSVTVGELRSLINGAVPGDIGDEFIHERTFHMKKTLRPMYGNKCSRCGGGVMESVRFCPNCGARLVDE